MWFKIFVRWCLLCLEDQASATKALRGTPNSTTPLRPNNSLRHPNSNHLSYQKDIVSPFPISFLWKCLANVLYLRIFLHIQDPILGESFTVQKDSLRIKKWCTHLTHIDSWDDTSLQISLRQHTLLISLNDLKPSPPSNFSLQTYVHAILAFLGFSSGPDQRKAENSLSNSLIHAWGRRKANSQKFDMLITTELMSCRRPASDKKRFVQALIHFQTSFSRGR